ncbi:MAG: ATP-binding protein [Pseudolabrys sp.]
MTGDRDLIFDAVANLVDNAIKHGRAAGQVIVEVAESSDGGATVTVADDGPGIPTVEYTNVFKRFYRLERSRKTAGNLVLSRRLRAFTGRTSKCSTICPA